MPSLVLPPTGGTVPPDPPRTFTYGGQVYDFPANSGCFLCNTTALDGTGAQSNPLLLIYRGQKQAQMYRNASEVAFISRDKPATQVGQYLYGSVDVTFSWPPVGTDYAGNPITAMQMEQTVANMVDQLQSGQFIEFWDARGRHYYGTFSADPQISDDGSDGTWSGWQTLTCSVVELGTG
jgi:hypothetical protein